MDAEHERRPAPIAELGAGDVAAAAVPEGGARPRHGDSVAALEQERSRPVGDLQDDLRLAGRAASVLFFVHARARTDRLPLAADGWWRAVPWVEADEGGEGFGQHAGKTAALPGRLWILVFL